MSKTIAKITITMYEDRADLSLKGKIVDLVFLLSSVLDRQNPDNKEFVALVQDAMQTLITKEIEEQKLQTQGKKVD